MDGAAKLSTAEVVLAGAAGRFVLEPAGPGAVTVTADSCGQTAKSVVDFKPVDFEERVVWDFESGKIEEPTASAYSYSVAELPDTGNHAVRIDFSGVAVRQPDNHIFDITKYPKGIPTERIGGVVFDIFVPDEFELDEHGGNLQAVLQSTGAYWIPCGQVQLAESRGEWRTVRMEIPNKQFLKVMDDAFSLLFVMHTEGPVSGPIYLDNIGFMLRPE